MIFRAVPRRSHHRALPGIASAMTWAYRVAPDSCPGRLPCGVVLAAFPLATRPPRLFAIDAEIVMQDSHRPVRIYRDMHGLVHQIVISGTLADHPDSAAQQAVLSRVTAAAAQRGVQVVVIPIR